MFTSKGKQVILVLAVFLAGVIAGMFRSEWEHGQTGGICAYCDKSIGGDCQSYHKDCWQKAADRALSDRQKLAEAQKFMRPPGVSDECLSPLGTVSGTAGTRGLSSPRPQPLALTVADR